MEAWRRAMLERVMVLALLIAGLVSFEPFFTTKPPGVGTGLGLSLVASLAKQCGGWVELATREGEGARFDVYLQAESDGEDAAERCRGVRPCHDSAVAPGE